MFVLSIIHSMYCYIYCLCYIMYLSFVHSFVCSFLCSIYRLLFLLFILSFVFWFFYCLFYRSFLSSIPLFILSVNCSVSRSLWFNKSCTSVLYKSWDFQWPQTHSFWLSFEPTLLLSSALWYKICLHKRSAYMRELINI